MNSNSSKKKYLDQCSVQHHTLNQDFYSSLKDEVNENRLLSLATISKDIPIPIVFGKFASDADYLATVDLLIKSTEETRNRCFFFLEKIIPELKACTKLLDVGPGNGKLNRIVGQKFDKITLIDPVPQVLEGILPTFYPKKTVLKKVCQSFLEIDLPENHFDLIVLSHVMYHFPLKNWIGVLEKAFSSLRPDGIMVVVINSGLDRETLGKNFGGITYNIENLLNQISQWNKKIDVYYSRESFQAKDLTTMLHICGLHLHDLNGQANQKDLEFYIKKNYFLKKESYRMEVYQHFIVIKNELVTNNK